MMRETNDHGPLASLLRPDQRRITPVSPSARGFGPLLDQEHALEISIRDNLLFVSGPRSAILRHLLEGQQRRVADGILLLEKRMESLPKPKRFLALAQQRARPVGGMPPPRPTGLAGLARQHLNLQGEILRLIVHRPEGSRTERLLVEVAGHHGEMASVLSSLLREDPGVRDRVAPPIVAARPVRMIREA